MMTDTPRILPEELAFDIDGVIADSFRAFVRTARDRYGLDIRYEEITDYDFRQVIDIDDKTSDEIVEMILEDPLGMGIDPIRGAAEVLRRLSLLRPIRLVTARSNREAIGAWFHRILGLGDGRDIIVEAVGSHKEKLPILLRHGIRYFVEDRLETCYLLHGSPVTPIVFEQPWNRGDHPFLRVENWEEIGEMIKWSP
ncbi:MAG: haloacid dehalogenase [Deltaproteobacteria bacterium]|nr:haloacid dehalogenase [Deltaproteobacteria bacterium]MBW2047363.1 haloacid dehalogenase [Deltaproteobacteria bacterium]MBW2110167.1 haloacid dehalogenase [Deltaproteobacteria bacterium]MBW2353971.1 haloacid dehalogenase [Deltaproteobacteria bacterium]